MKILSSSQIKQLDAYTIQHKPIASINLMERAAQAFTQWFTHEYTSSHPVCVLCGLGNNGGDGLAIARLLRQCGYTVEVVIVWYSDKTSEDFALNHARLQYTDIPVREVRQAEDIPGFGSSILIDAMFGSGLSRPVTGLAAQVIQAIHPSQTVVAVDVPSGLFMDTANAPANCIVKATHTVSFQLPKLAFVLPQNADFVGSWHLVDIGLHPTAIEHEPSRYFYTDFAIAQSYLRKRKKFSHKGTNGHALLIAGSYGMMGAAILSARACLRSGVGKLTIHAPKTANELMQGNVPEALFSADPDAHFSLRQWKPAMLDGIAAVGLGPGLGTPDAMVEAIRSLIDCCAEIPMVIDADGLNNLASATGRPLLQRLPPNTILTPHPREFQKLLDRQWQNDYEKLDLLREFATDYRVVVCLKGAHTAVALPDGTVHFNSTGNPGMATGGTGDVLTGIITALLAQKYPPAEAAILGVYLHGLAGDQAAKHKSVYSMMASDLYEFLPEAFQQLALH